MTSYECRRLYSITQMYKLLQFALLKCFIAKATYHGIFKLPILPPHQNFGSHPIDLGFLTKKNTSAWYADGCWFTLARIHLWIFLSVVGDNLVCWRVFEVSIQFIMKPPTIILSHDAQWIPTRYHKKNFFKNCDVFTPCALGGELYRNWAHAWLQLLRHLLNKLGEHCLGFNPTLQMQMKV